MEKVRFRKALIEKNEWDEIHGKIKISFDMDVYFSGGDDMTPEEIENITVRDVWEAIDNIDRVDLGEELLNNISIDDIYIEG